MILDSNVIIYSIRSGYELLLDYLDKNVTDLEASLITQLEVIGYHKITPAEKVSFDAFFLSIAILPIDESIVYEAIRLRQQQKRSLGDSIIAATGLIYDLPLLTNYTADFLTIPGLRVIALADVLSA